MNIVETILVDDADDREGLTAEPGLRAKPPRLLAELVQILHKRHRRAVEPVHLGVGRFDDVVLVGSVRAASMPQAEVAGSEAQRSAGEGVARVRSSIAQPQDRIDAAALEHGDLRLISAAFAGVLVGSYPPVTWTSISPNPCLAR